MNAEEMLRHGAFLRSLAAGLLGGDDGADDIVQEAYLKALARPPRRPRAWLARVVRNLVYRRHRTRTRRRARERAAARPEAVPGGEDAAARLEIQRRVVDAVLALPEPYRSTVVRRFYDGLTPREIARRTQTPYETVRTRLARALERLRRQLDAEDANWSLALVPLLVRPRSVSLGAIAMSAKKTLTLVALPLLGIAVGVAGHAAYLSRNPPVTERTRAPGGAPAGVAAELAELREETRRLRLENAELRARRAPDEPRAEAPRSGGPDAEALDWSELLPLLRAVAATDPNRGQRLDAAHEGRLDDLIQELARRGHMRDGMLLQDLWRVPPVAAGVAFAFARELEPGLDAAVRDEMQRAFESIDAELPPDPLEIELLAAVEQQLLETEAILARRADPEVARRVAAEASPLWRRRYWQTLHLGTPTKGEMHELIAGMTGALSGEEQASLQAAVDRMAVEFKALRADLVRKHREETVRAVLLEPGSAGDDEARLGLARKRADYATAAREVRAAVAGLQARFEREHFRSLSSDAQEKYAQIAATLLLFDLAG